MMPASPESAFKLADQRQIALFGARCNGSGKNNVEILFAVRALRMELE
jgi:hypothetical protein